MGFTVIYLRRTWLFLVFPLDVAFMDLRKWLLFQVFLNAIKHHALDPLLTTFHRVRLMRVFEDPVKYVILYPGGSTEGVVNINRGALSGSL